MSVNSKQQPKHQVRRPRQRDRALPSRNAFRYSLRDAQMLGAPGKTTLYEMMKDGRLERAPDVPGLPTGITGDSLRALLGIKESEVA
jgi:hypothetical protein